MLDTFAFWACSIMPSLKPCRLMVAGSSDELAVVLAEVLVKIGVAMVYFVIPLTLWKLQRRLVSLPFRSLLMICIAFTLLSGAGSLASAVSILYGGWARWLNIGIGSAAMAVAIAACITLYRNAERLSDVAMRLIGRMDSR